MSLETLLKYFIVIGPNLTDIKQFQADLANDLYFTVSYLGGTEPSIRVKVDQFAFLTALFKHEGGYPGFKAHVIFPDGTGVDVIGNYNTMTQRGEFTKCDQ